jgi:hypothetical protein
MPLKTISLLYDGYVIAKLGNTGRVMLGLSSDNTDSSYTSIDYALYADSGIGNKFVLLVPVNKNSLPAIVILL